MTTEWPLTRLRDHVDLRTGHPFKSSGFTSDPSHAFLLRGDNIAQGYLRWDGARRWPTTELDSLHDYLLRPGDVVLAMDRPWIEAGLKRATVAEYDVPVYLVQRVARLRAGPRLHQRFLRYLLDSEDFTNHVLAVQTGTSVPHISGSQILEFSFPLPPLGAQQAIAHILGALDDKISLNRGLNETLEATCKALFRSWFVDFDPVVARSEGNRPPHLSPQIAKLFPSRIRETEIGPIPDGWTLAPIADIAALYRESVNPLNHPTTEFALYSIPAFDTGVGPEGQIGAAIKSNKFALRVPCVLVSKLNPRIPRVWLPDLQQSPPAIASTEFLVATPKGETPLGFLYQLFRSDAFLDEFATLVTGTSGSHQRVKPDDFLRMGAVVPPLELQKVADAFFSPALERVLANVRESRTLSALRDALLPRLLSGELRVREAEELVGGAV